MSAVGVFYCLKLGAFRKGKRLLCGIATACGIGLTIYFVKINFYASYYYLDMPIGIFITVLLNLYILVIYDAVKERRIPFSFAAFPIFEKLSRLPVMPLPAAYS